MKRLPYKPLFLSLTMLTIGLFMNGCVNAEHKLEQSIHDAVTQAQSGNALAAINRLESLQDEHPEHPGIAEALGIAYRERGNHLLAANHFQKAARLSSEKRALLLDSANSLYASGRAEDAAQRMRSYLEFFPEDGETWLLLGTIQHEAELSEQARESLARGLLLTAESAQKAPHNFKLGRLFLKNHDYPQADFYLNAALSLVDDPSLEALILVALVESSIEQEDWDVAQLFVRRLQLHHPEEVREERTVGLMEQVVRRSRSIRELPSDEREVTVQADETPESVRVSMDETTDALEVDEPEPTETREEVVTFVAESPVEAVEPVVDTAEVEPVPVVPESVVDDEALDADTTLSESDSPMLAMIVKDEAAVHGDTEVLPDEVEEEAPTDDSYTLHTDDGVGAEEAVSESVDAEAEGIVEEQVEDAPTAQPEVDLQSMVARARDAVVRGETIEGIRYAWQAVNRYPESPSAWFILSYGYSRYGQYLNAEAAALESLRLNPGNRLIALHYLSVLQHSRSAERFHDETLRLYERFPNDPDFILATARSYARVKQDAGSAAALYRRFLERFPGHAKVDEVEAELALVE